MPLLHVCNVRQVRNILNDAARRGQEEPQDRALDCHCVCYHDRTDWRHWGSDGLPSYRKKLGSHSHTRGLRLRGCLGDRVRGDRNLYSHGLCLRWLADLGLVEYANGQEDQDTHLVNAGSWRQVCSSVKFVESFIAQLTFSIVRLCQRSFAYPSYNTGLSIKINYVGYLENTSAV